MGLRRQCPGHVAKYVLSWRSQGSLSGPATMRSCILVQPRTVVIWPCTSTQHGPSSALPQMWICNPRIQCPAGGSTCWLLSYMKGNVRSTASTWPMLRHVAAQRTGSRDWAASCDGPAWRCVRSLSVQAAAAHSMTASTKPVRCIFLSAIVNPKVYVSSMVISARTVLKCSVTCRNDVQTQSVVQMYLQLNGPERPVANQRAMQHFGNLC